MRAVPVPDPRVAGDDGILTGEVPSPASPPSGCYFHPRCVFAENRCRQEAPVLQEVTPGHFARCHFAADLDLQLASVPRASSQAVIAGAWPHGR